jgi:integrase
MPRFKKSKTKAERVVRHKLKDGTVKVYRYDSYKPTPIVRPVDTMSAVIEAYQRSPEWLALADASRTTYSIYLLALDKIGRTRADSIRRRDILDLRDAIAAGRGNGAGNAFVRTASAMFTWAVNREWLEYSPVTKIRPLPGGHLRAWTVAEADIALAGLPWHLRRVVVLGLYTGQRRGDLIAMGWSAYDRAAISLVQQKTGTPLVLPVHPALKTELDAWKETRTATTILTNRKGLPWDASTLSQVLPDALVKLGLSGELNVHGLRKLAATNLAQAGCSVHEIASITGHKTLSMVELYTRSVDQERLAGAAVVRLSAYKENTNARKNGKT